MAIHQLNNLAHENQMKPLKFQRFKEKDQKANGVSFWAFLFSIFIFISIFYIFNLSPSSLLNTTKFWFCISNALILIIAVDFGASKKQAEIYEEYVEKGVGNVITFPSLEYQYLEKEIAKPNNPPQPEKEAAKTDIPPQKEKNLQEAPEEEKEVVVDVHVHVVSESESSESNMQVVVNDDLKMSVEEDEGKMVELPPELDHGEEEEEEEEEDDDDDDDDEFSKMSNEELNRRVEEFIQRFNRQIRLQAAQNRIEQMQTGK